MSRVTGKILGMSLRHALLGLLAEHPASGYELTKQFERSLAHVWSAKHSQIYPELAKMAAASGVGIALDADRVPLSLYEIGASTAVFLRRHAPEARREMHHDAFAHHEPLLCE